VYLYAFYGLTTTTLRSAQLSPEKLLKPADGELNTVSLEEENHNDRDWGEKKKKNDETSD